MKVIFLDVDGVLSSFGERGLCGRRIALFADVVQRTGAKVVLSSTWRLPHCRDQRMRLQQELGKHGVELLSMTPVLGGPVGARELDLVGAVTRGEEIRGWLEMARRWLQPVLQYVILDDDPNDEMGDLRTYLVKCDGYEGLTAAVAEEVVRRLD